MTRRHHDTDDDTTPLGADAIASYRARYPHERHDFAPRMDDARASGVIVDLAFGPRRSRADIILDVSSYPPPRFERPRSPDHELFDNDAEAPEPDVDVDGPGSCPVIPGCPLR